MQCLNLQRNMGAMMRILSQLPKTLVLLLEPPDYTQFGDIPNRGFICNFFVTQGCSCLFEGDSVAKNRRKIRHLLQSYTKSYHRLAEEFQRKDFGVEVIPAVVGLPPKERRGYRVLPTQKALSHDCFHYNGRTQDMVSRKNSPSLTMNLTKIYSYVWKHLTQQ